MTDLADLVVIGGGQSGLAAAHAARRAGLASLLLEAGDHAAGSWPRATTTASRCSRPRATPSCRGGASAAIPTATRHATRSSTTSRVRGGLDGASAPASGSAAVERGLTVITERDSSCARPRDRGDRRLRPPYRPPLPGLDDFAGVALHAADYRQPEPSRDSASSWSAAATAPSR